MGLLFRKKGEKVAWKRVLFEALVGLAIGLALAPIAASWFDREPELPFRVLVVQDGVDRSYAGKYADDPGFLSLLELAPDLREAAIDRAEARTGLTEIGDPPLVVAFEDATGDGFMGQTGLVDTPQGRVLLITLGTEEVLLGTFDLKRTLTHEAVHGIMRQHRKGAWRKVPKWFVEGSALWAAGDVEDRLRIQAARSLQRLDDPDEMLDGLESLPHGKGDYPEDGLAFAWLERTAGAAAVREAIAAVCAGQDADAAFSAAAGRVGDWEGVQADVRAMSVATIEDLVDRSGFPEYEKAYLHAKEREFDAAVAGYERFIETHPNSLLAGVAQFELAGARRLAGDLDRALCDYREFVRDFVDHRWLVDNAQYSIGNVCRDLGDCAGAARAYERFLHDFSWTGVGFQANARLDLAEAYLGLDKPERAVIELERALLVLEHAVRSRALCRLADAHRAAGRTDRAEEVSEQMRGELPDETCEESLFRKAS